MNHSPYYHNLATCRGGRKWCPRTSNRGHLVVATILDPLRQLGPTEQLGQDIRRPQLLVSSSCASDEGVLILARLFFVKNREHQELEQTHQIPNSFNSSTLTSTLGSHRFSAFWFSQSPSGMSQADGHSFGGDCASILRGSFLGGSSVVGSFSLASSDAMVHLFVRVSWPFVVLVT